ncbi:hypothetical protein BH24ACT26_BH24ACT26_02470 [soil metagenome]
MRFRAVLSAVAGLLVMPLSMTPALGQEEERVRALPSVRVSQSTLITRTYEGPAVAISPADPARVYIATADIQTNSCHIFESTDEGRTFRELAGPDFGELVDCGLNKGADLAQNIRMGLTFDPDGVLYWAVAVADPAALGGRSVVLARSDDDGESWDTTVVAEAPVPSKPEGAVANFEPDVFVDPFGDAPRTVWVSWRRSFDSSTEKPTEGWAAVSKDGGETFEAEVRPFNKNPGFDAPHLVMDDAGAVHWFQREVPAQQAEQGEEPNPSPLLMAKSDDDGSTWEVSEVGEAEVVMEEPWAGVSPDGSNLYLVWADGRSGTDVDVFFKRSTDGGETWDDSVRINDDVTENRRQQKWPRMSVAPNGRIDIAWYDYRNDSKQVPKDDVEFFLGDLNDVYYSFSEDDGASFSPNLRVTDVPIDRTIGTYNTQYFVEVPPGIGSADDMAYFAWSDTRLGNQDTSAQDIFGTAVTFPSGADSALGLSGRSLLLGAELFLIGAGLALFIGTAVIRARSRRGATAT